MLWTAYRDGSQRLRIGVLQEGTIYALEAGTDFIGMLGSDRSLAEWGALALSDPTERVAEEAATLAALIPIPPSIRDFMAFEEHVVTSSAALGLPLHPDWYDLPVFYFTNPAAVKDPNQPLRIAPGSSKFDFELEFAAVIGRAGSDVSVDEAEDFIAGYMSLCDWSARDLQEREMKLNLGPSKGKDTATTLGPRLVTSDEMQMLRAGKGFDIAISASVNGRKYGEGNLASIYWSFAQMVSYASRGTELRPGDIIGSGTVGTGCVLELSQVHGEDAFPYLRPGDEVVIDAGILGRYTTLLTPGVDPKPLL